MPLNLSMTFRTRSIAVRNVMVSVYSSIKAEDICRKIWGTALFLIDSLDTAPSFVAPPQYMGCVANFTLGNTFSQNVLSCFVNSFSILQIIYPNSFYGTLKSSFHAGSVRKVAYQSSHRALLCLFAQICPGIPLLCSSRTLSSTRSSSRPIKVMIMSSVSVTLLSSIIIAIMAKSRRRQKFNAFFAVIPCVELCFLCTK